jgi:hypothetical protein
MSQKCNGYDACETRGDKDTARYNFAGGKKLLAQEAS